MEDDERKTYGNTSSAYLSLKAELLRKKQDLQKASSSTVSSDAILNNLQSTSSSLKIKTNAELDVEVANPSKKKKKTDEPSSSSQSTTSSSVSREDEIAFAKSRAILEAKSKLYEQIMSNGEMRVLAEDDGGDDENNKSFLVDFERKIYETNQIEYTDSFGRTRLVTPEEYEKLKANETKEPEERKHSSKLTENEIDRVERLHREQMRSKWEAEMEALRDKSQVHYQDLLFDEKREHGVGYYKFSTDDQQRAEQMAMLNELRANTKVEQDKFQQGREKRQANMTEKLNKMRLRKAKELGINLSDTTEKSTPSNNQDISNERKDQSIEPTPIPKTEEIKSPEVIQLPKQIISTPPSQTQPPVKPKNSSIAYPFPVMRSNPHLSLTSTSSNAQSSNKH